MREWRKPKNKSELEPGSRVRVVTFDVGLLDTKQAKTMRRLLADKRHAADVVGMLDSAKWMYGIISISGKVIDMDNGGMAAIPTLRMIEIHVERQAAVDRSLSNVREFGSTLSKYRTAREE